MKKVVLTAAIILAISSNGMAADYDDAKTMKDGCTKQVVIQKYGPEDTDDVHVLADQITGYRIKKEGASLSNAAFMLGIDPNINYDKLANGWRKFTQYINGDHYQADVVIWFISTPAIYSNNEYRPIIFPRFRGLVNSFSVIDISAIIAHTIENDLKRSPAYERFLKALLLGDSKGMIKEINDLDKNIIKKVMEEKTKLCKQAGY